MRYLEGKRILFFSPKFFNYEIAIKEELENEGAIVHLYDERGNPSSFQKVLIRKCSFLLKSKILHYYKSIIDKESQFQPDFVFFLSPETATKECIDLLRHIFVSAKFILYMYDSLQNKNAKHIYPYFDKTLSFDPNDCKKYGFIFRPLFFIKSFESKIIPVSYQYDFCFIGTIHSDRAKILYLLKQYFEKNGLSYYYYLFIPGNLLYSIRWILDKYVRKFGKKFIHTESIDKTTISSIASHSKCIIDINHPNQVGLTMRTIEMLGLKQKVLTTNEHIKEYDFYEPKNQIVISRSGFNVPLDSVNGEYIPTDDIIYNSYSLNSWIKTIFS